MPLSDEQISRMSGWSIKKVREVSKYDKLDW